MTRRTLLGALAVLPIPLAGVERVRYRPQAGDVITGPNGTRVEVVEVLTQTLSDGAEIEMVYYTSSYPEKKQFAHITRAWRSGET